MPMGSSIVLSRGTRRVFNPGSVGSQSLLGLPMIDEGKVAAAPRELVEAPAP